MRRGRVQVVRQDRRTLLRLAALGLAGAALSACGGGDAEPRTTVRIETPTPLGGARKDGEPVPTSAPPTATPTPNYGQPVCLVSKDPERNVPATYVPPDLVVLPAWTLALDGVQLRKSAADAFVAMAEDARAQGLKVMAQSGYRSYEMQQQVYAEQVRLTGQAQADRLVAPPGHSEHQLGQAVDVFNPLRPYDLDDQAFGEQAEGRWLAANSHRYGYILSYPRDKESITGYSYEPWHFRFVGLPLAKHVAESGLTLTEFLPRFGMAGSCP